MSSRVNSGRANCMPPKRRFWKDEQKMLIKILPRRTIPGRMSATHFPKECSWTDCEFSETPVGRTMVNHSPSKSDECPPNIYKRNVCMLTVNDGKCILDGLWLRSVRARSVLHVQLNFIPPNQDLITSNVCMWVRPFVSTFHTPSAF